MDADFEPEGWSAFDEHGNCEKGNAGCVVLLLGLLLVAIIIALMNK